MKTSTNINQNKSMKKYSYIQRIANIATRAAEFGFKYDGQDSLDEIYDNACNCIFDNVEYDRIEEVEMSNHHSFLAWSDGMGYNLESSGEFIGEASRSTWYKKQEDGTFKAIKWFEVDYENDYVVCHHDIDSEGKVVRMVCK